MDQALIPKKKSIALCHLNNIHQESWLQSFILCVRNLFSSLGMTHLAKGQEFCKIQQSPWSKLSSDLRWH